MGFRASSLMQAAALSLVWFVRTEGGVCKSRAPALSPGRACKSARDYFRMQQLGVLVTTNAPPICHLCDLEHVQANVPNIA